MFKHFIFAAMTAALVACSGPAGDAGEGHAARFVNAEVSADTRLAAVLIYADWCGSCKVLDPKLQSAKSEGPIEGLQHFVLNYTDRDEDALFMAADKLGFGGPIREKLSDGVKTGILLLVDLDDGTVVGDLRKELSAEEIRAAMVAATRAA